MKRMTYLFSTNAFRVMLLNLLGVIITGVLVANFHSNWAWLAWALISLYVSFWSFVTSFAIFAGIVAIRKVRYQIRQIVFLQRICHSKTRQGIKDLPTNFGFTPTSAIMEEMTKEKKKLYAYIEWINKSVKGFNT